jgi:hypothetical protein
LPTSVRAKSFPATTLCLGQRFLAVLTPLYKSIH